MNINKNVTSNKAKNVTTKKKLNELSENKAKNVRAKKKLDEPWEKVKLLS